MQQVENVFSKAEQDGDLLKNNSSTILIRNNISFSNAPVSNKSQVEMSRLIGIQRVSCGRMRETWRQTLTNRARTPYSMGGGDIFMAGENSEIPKNPQGQQSPEASRASNPKQESVTPNPAEQQKQARLRGIWEQWEKDVYGDDPVPVDTKRFVEDAIGKSFGPTGMYKEAEEGTQNTSPGEPTPQGGGRGGEGKKPPAPPIRPPGGNPSKEPNNQNESKSENRESIRVTDKKAADLISKFFQEGGETDRGKTQQLRVDLSKRIDELMEEQYALGDSDEVKTPEGKAVVDAKIDELGGRINQIQEVLADMFSSREGNRWRDPEAGKLIEETEIFVNGLLKRGLRLNEINDLARLTPGERLKRSTLVREIKEYIERSPSLESSSFPSEILLSVRYFKELREELISDIMFKSFEDRSETNEYEVNLYADSNLNTLLGFMSKDDNERYRYFFSLRTAARFFQSMNATVLKGTFDSFGHSAENINYQHFENMRDIRGSGLAMRLYEQAYKDAIAADKRVTQDKIAGIKAFVESTFKEINEAGLIKSEYTEYREDSKLENWEVQRALHAGRSFLNITLRAAENIATGQVPLDRKRYTSPPQEDMVRILNWNQWLLARFSVGGGEDGRHGVEFLKMTTDRYQEFLRYKGAKLGVNKIIEFGGVDVRKMEDGSQYRTSGVYSGWRLENMAFDEIYFNYNGERISVQKFRDTPGIKDRIKRIKDRIEERKKANPNADPKDLVEEVDQEEYRDVLMPVVDNLNYGLSMLIKNGDFGAQDNKLGYLLRAEIWRKVARTNVPLMIDYLTDIKYEEHVPEAERSKSMDNLRATIVPNWENEQWESFRKKVLVRFERTIREGMGEQLSPIPTEYELNVEERRLEGAIKEQGEKLAPHLADIVFAYTPFMNDMPFESFKYSYPGQTFYKRRTTGDLGGFNKGQQAYTKILSNPGGIPAKEAVGAMGEIVAGIEGPEGPRPAIEANFPTFSALLDVVTTDPWKRQAMFKMLLEATRKETSIAQRWAGIKGDSFVESEAANLIDETTRAGILTPELARYLKKEKNLMLTAILWMLFRDVFIMVPVFAAAELTGKIIKEK